MVYGTAEAVPYNDLAVATQGLKLVLLRGRMEMIRLTNIRRAAFRASGSTSAGRIRHPLGIAVFTAIAIAICGASASAQGSRKDDIVFNAQGRPMAGATVRVCTSAATGQPCAPLAPIYSDEGLTQALANPTATDGMGNYTFYAAPGRYEIEIGGPSITTQQFPNVILPNDPSAPTFATVTSTSGISAFSLSLSGNLTVSGSAAVTGSLTVGGAPVPSTNEDNQWTASQRFKGSDPWRDITAYMPAGGCDNSTASTNRQIGTISGGSTALGLTYDNNYKNGCGIFVYGAGPASTLATPAQGAAPNPNVVGPTGSTMVHYEVAAIDPNFGTSAASAPITITTAPSARTPLNYVGIYWTSVAGAAGYLIYSDRNGGGTYVPLGYSFDCNSFTAGYTCGAIDKGAETYTWTGFNGFWPTTPPATVTNQALITTIVSGAGTLSLTLATAATNTVSGTFTLPDNSMFIKQAIADASSDGSPSIVNKGTVFIPEGYWFFSSIPFPSTGIAGVKIVQSGAIMLYGLPIEGSLPSAGTSGDISMTGTGGIYGGEDFLLSCSNINGYQSLGALFVVSGTPGGLNLENECLNTAQGGIVQGPLGEITTHDMNLAPTGSGIGLQIDNNTYFSIFDNTNFNDSANNTNNNIPIVWFLGLTNSGHNAGFTFNNSTFVSHTIRYDNPYPMGGGPVGAGFSGYTSVEDNWDLGFINEASNYAFGADFEGIVSGDLNVPTQAIFYSYNNLTNPGPGAFVHDGAFNFLKFADSALPGGGNTYCRTSVLDNVNAGGSGAESIGYWGNQFGTYDECDLGITRLGYDVQTTEVLTGGGNDPIFSPAGEQMIGHVFRRPVTTTTAGSGSLAAGTYYIKVTMVDVAGRESAPSREVSQAVGASGSVGVTSVSGTYFPASCNVYFGTAAGGEAGYFNTTAITNGTCTYTLTTTSGATAKAPQAVGNAMNTWLTEENNANSCLYCGSSGGLGTGFLGFNLTAAQYGAPPAGVQFPFNGGVHSYKFYSAAETNAPAGIANVDELYADSTAHRWEKIENNGTPQIVGSADSSACAYQGPGSAITGTGATATYFTCTLPAGVMGAGQGIIVTVVAKHTTGTANINYTLSFGGTSTTAASPAGAANQLEHITYLIMNNPGSTNAQTISTVGQDSSAGTNSIKLDTAAVNTASAVTIDLQFNAASTDAITPEMFLVELKQ